MQNPQGWWQGRLERSNPLGESRLRASSSGVQAFAAETNTDPIFFVPPTYDSGGRLAGTIAVGDFNGDGKPDLLVSNQCVSDADCTKSTVAVLLGNGDGTYQPAVVSNTGAVAQILSCLLGTLLTMPGNNENWEELYRQAVQELDFQKIVATRDAIAGRLRDLVTATIIRKDTESRMPCTP